MKKASVTFTILVLCAGTIFFLGWIQFTVPAGKYGVLISKTGGVNSRPIIPGQFRWQWEKIIPTNSEIQVFDLIPLVQTTTFNGVLPSGDLYSKMLEGDPDFSWELELKISARVRAEALPDLVHSLNIRSQEGLDEWLKATTEQLVRTECMQAMTDILANSSSVNSFQTSGIASIEGQLKQGLDHPDLSKIEILTLTILTDHLPDFELYLLAGKTYREYQSRRQILLTEAAAAEARDSVSEYLQIERFSRWGEVITKYPLLIDFLAVTKDDQGETFKAVKSLRITR